MIRNLSKNSLIAKNHTTAAKLLDRVIGLIGKDTNAYLVLKTRFGIHTFGMKNPIDILILNNKKRVVNIKESFPPRRIFLWNPRHDTVVEMPKDSIRKSKTTIGDLLDF